MILENGANGQSCLAEMDFDISHGIVHEHMSKARKIFSTDCGKLYVEAKNFGFIHELWNHPLIMVFESSIIDNMNIKLAV